jgi:flagellar export protein FliJ
MKKFRFSLDAALQLRRRRVEAEEEQFRQIGTALEAVAAAARQLTSELREAEDGAGVSLTTAVELQSLDSFRAAAARKLRDFEFQRESIRRDLARQQQRLVTARRDEELLLKLKAKARAQWQAAADKELQDIADEAYLSQWARSR